MTATCPQGHRSEALDYCDQCGALIDSSGNSGFLLAQPEEVMAAVTAVVKATTVEQRCPDCNAPRATGDLFCENCGFDFGADAVRPATATPAPAQTARARWTAVVTADRGLFDRVAPEGIAFPDERGPRSFTLDHRELRIGRLEAGGDPAVSRLHAVIAPDGDGYVLVDKGSTNGTTVNDSRIPIPPNVPQPLAEGDRIYLGAWTTITLHRDGSTES